MKQPFYRQVSIWNNSEMLRVVAQQNQTLGQISLIIAVLLCAKFWPFLGYESIETERLWLTHHIFKAHHRVSFPKHLLGVLVQCAGGLRRQDRLHKHGVVEKTTRAPKYNGWVEMSGKLWCKNVPCLSRNCKIFVSAILAWTMTHRIL